MAGLASELATEIADTEQWPKEFQGGRVKLFKGRPLNCDDYRGILLASHLAQTGVASVSQTYQTSL